jgi:hypothetical protein
VEWADLIVRCWADDPDARPDFDEVQRQLATIATTLDTAGRGEGAVLGSGVGVLPGKLHGKGRVIVAPMSPAAGEAGGVDVGAGVGLIELDGGVVTSGAGADVDDGSLEDGEPYGVHTAAGTSPSSRERRLPANGSGAGAAPPPGPAASKLGKRPLSVTTAQPAASTAAVAAAPPAAPVATTVAVGAGELVGTGAGSVLIHAGVGAHLGDG